MAVRHKTLFIANEIYFITFTILGWKHIFVNDEYCDLVFKWFDYMKEKYGNKIYGYVIMPNHIHLLLYINDRSPQLPVLIFNAKKFLAFGIRDLLIKTVESSGERICGGVRRQICKPAESPNGRFRRSADDNSERFRLSINDNSGRACCSATDLLNFFASNKTKSKANYKIFEPRYDSLIIQSQKFFLEKLNYIHRNPCAEKWQIAENPEDYKYSSASNYIIGNGFYDTDVMDF